MVVKQQYKFRGDGSVLMILHSLTYRLFEYRRKYCCFNDDIRTDGGIRDIIEWLVKSGR